MAKSTRALAVGVHPRERLVELSWSPGVPVGDWASVINRVLLLIGYRRGAGLFLQGDRWCGVVCHEVDLPDVLRLLIRDPKDRTSVLNAVARLWTADERTVIVWSPEFRHFTN